MHFSTLFVATAAATAGLTAPVPAGYAWTITDWSGGITIPALSLTRRCTPVGAVGSVTDCSDLIVNNSDGRKLTASFQESSDVATLVSYTFNSGGT